MGGAVTIRGLQLIAHLALRGQGQALLRNRGPGNVSAKTFQLVALIGAGGNAGVEIKPSHLTHFTVGRLIHVDRRQCLQSKYLAPCLRAEFAFLSLLLLHPRGFTICPSSAASRNIKTKLSR